MKYLFVFFLLTLQQLVPAQNEVLFQLEKLPEFINSAYDEITPVPSRDGNTLYFTRVAYPEFNRYLFLDSVDLYKKYPQEKYERILRTAYSELAGKSVHDPASSPFNQDVWIAESDTLANFYYLEHPAEPLNNALPNSITCITPDPNAFYCINQFSEKGDMTKGFSLIRRVDSTWTFPVPVEIAEYYTITSDVNLTMSFDGQVLILSAVRHDSRDMDLFVCFNVGNNKWSTPQHLGCTVNSEKRETTPFLSEDNLTLFFSSNRWESSGGNDIFMCKRLDETWKNWSEPQRLVEPINSRADESQPYFNMTSGYLYFTSTRDGNSDIFRVRIAPPQPTEFSIRGRVFNRKTHELMPNAVVRYGAANVPENTLTSINGFFTLKIPKGVRFGLTPGKEAFIGQTEEVFFRQDYYFFQEYYQVDLWLDPLEVDAKIDLRPIYFQQSTAVILEKSFSELDRLASILTENPGLEIRIEGHTDNVGKDEDLLVLSEKRAVAICEFLIGKGIKSHRISTEGYGQKYPVSANTSEEQRALNRRVEVRITKI
ncbi:MAG: OmpA family protein [Saprospiraceae bacterium]|jgi:OOP family OmpA-OmpF porin|nr:OmpA family protein [Saprospiraceae bacterium]